MSETSFPENSAAASTPAPLVGGEALFHAVLQSLHEGMTVTDPQMNIVWVNQACSDISGYPFEAIIGKTPRMFSSGRQSRRFYEEMWQSINDNGWWAGEILNRRANGEIYAQWLSIASIVGDDGKVRNYVSMFSDITARKSVEAEILRLRLYDGLTSLPNRALFFDRLDQTLSGARQHQSKVALLVADLDHLKVVNDNFGHTQGDKVLQRAAQRLIDELRPHDIIARISGDEFGIILNFIAGETDVAARARSFIAAMEVPIQVADQAHHIGVSIGIALYPDDADDSETLLRHADAAMHQAKLAGRATSRRVTRDWREAREQEARMQGLMHAALEAGEFFLMYQPQVSAQSNQLVGLEALIRWRKPDGTVIPPGQFIPLAERSGLIADIDRYVVSQGAQQIAAWTRAGLPMVPVSFNLSAGQFMKAGVEKQIVSLLRGRGVDPRGVVLEITETAAMSDLGQTIRVLEAWRALGIGVGIDDFGTGFSSLNYLRKFPANSLKIDQSFVRALDDSAADRALVESILDMAKKLGLEIVAEGVEQPSQYEFLRERGCDVIQGYLFSRPISVEDTTALLRRGDEPMRMTA